MPGPVPKRSDQRRRRNKPEGAQPVKAAAGDRPDMPPADEGWAQIARDWYLSLGESGQSAFYEASDWQTARYVAEAMSRNLSGISDGEGGKRFSSELFKAVMSAMTDLLTTEGARRRARVELERNPGDGEAPPGVAIMDSYRKAADAAG